MAVAKSLSQVVVVVVHDEFKLMRTSLQELVVAQSIAEPGKQLSATVLVNCGRRLHESYLNSAYRHMQPGNSQQTYLSCMRSHCQLISE